MSKNCLFYLFIKNDTSKFVRCCCILWFLRCHVTFLLFFSLLPLVLWIKPKSTRQVRLDFPSLLCWTVLATFATVKNQTTEQLLCAPLKPVQTRACAELREPDADRFCSQPTLEWERKLRLTRCLHRTRWLCTLSLRVVGGFSAHALWGFVMECHVIAYVPFNPLYLWYSWTKF